MTDSFEFTLNGKPVRVRGESPTTTLLEYLRTHGHTGSKRGCNEGDCGACTAVIVDRHASGHAAYRAITSCITLLPMLAGREVLTVEGFSAPGGPLHPAQRTLAEHFGSQCGYCTPGFVASLFEGCYRPGCQTPAQISDQLAGNLCRCTGYRPIRDAAAAAVAECAHATAETDSFRARLARPVAPLAAFAYAPAHAPERFFRPGSLAELFTLLAAHPQARLVAGATEIGVELNKIPKPLPVLVSVEAVPELKVLVAEPARWRIGAAVTLTTIEEAVALEFPALGEMLRVFASRQVRNLATLGGSLATASPIGDPAPLLLALDASVVLARAEGERTVPLTDFFAGYRKTALRPGEVIREIVLPRGPAAEGLTRQARFFKVSKRREVDISIVAAAFVVDCDATGVVRRARLGFGGVAATPLRARAIEEELVGRPLVASADPIAERLRATFQPIDDVRAGAGYRRGLLGSLWEKFATGTTSAALDDAIDFAFSAPWPVDDATKALRHESAVGHVTGRALYVDDTAQQRPMLDVAFVRSPHAHAKILRRDATRARAAAGVAAVLLAEDIPGENNTGPVRHDEPLLARDLVQFHGQVVALVVAETPGAARAAAALVEVDYAPLAPLVGVHAAIAAGSFHTTPHALSRGDCAAALAAAPHRFTGEFEFGGQEHFYLETQAAWAEPGEDGAVSVSSSTQHPSEIQAIVAEVLHVARHKVVVTAPRMGGGFGGKETQGNAIAAWVALAAAKTGRPVRLQLDRDDDMALTGKRHPFFAQFEIGHDDAGRVLAAKVGLVSDGGWSLDLSQPIADRALFHLDNAYYLPAVDFSSRVAKTNVTSHTAFRGFGGPQGMLVIEEILDRVARRTGLAPEVVRERNLYHGTGETNRTHYREDVGDNRIQTIWRQLLDESRFAARRSELAAWNAAHPHVKRGLAITPVKFGISFTLTHYNQAGALVLIYQDGSVQVNHGGTEMGQGLHTKILGVALRELGLPASAVRIMPTSTDKVPNTSATAASSGADLNGFAVAAACATLRERLAPVAAGIIAETVGAALRRDSEPAAHNPTIAPEEIVFADGHVFAKQQPAMRVPFAQVCAKAYTERVSLAATGYYKTPGIHWNWATAEGRPFHYFACGAAVAEVEVDGFTGLHRVQRVDIVHDVGDSLNPGLDRGQIEGGFVQGMGWLTREELKWDPQGRLLTHGASTYQIPALGDAPAVFNVTLLPHAAQPNTIHGSKAVGEPPLMLAIAVREALRDAVAAFGSATRGEVALASPATGEAIYAAVQQRLG